MTRYRYTLARKTRISSSATGTFIMLNPSTADETQDDATIRRCTTFAESFGWGRYEVANLFALRATNPDDLWNLSEECDIVGPRNAAVLEGVIQGPSMIVVAWGSPSHQGVRTLTSIEVRKLIAQIDGRRKLYCLGTTKDGSPRHPLYVSSKAECQPWSHEGWRSKK